MDRFWSKVNKTETCWLWTAVKTQGGYGRVRVNGKLWLAHRYAYEMEVGPVYPGLVLDHLCRQPSCVRPSHLEPVTHAENVRRGNGGRPKGPGAKKSGRSRNPDGSFVECPQGHLMAGDNLYVRPSGVRDCRRCNADRHSWPKGV